MNRRRRSGGGTSGETSHPHPCAARHRRADPTGGAIGEKPNENAVASKLPEASRKAAPLRGRALSRGDADRQRRRYHAARAPHPCRGRHRRLRGHPGHPQAVHHPWHRPGAVVATGVRRLPRPNEAEVCRRLIERIAEGARVAFVSDAGTPLVSDPGYRLVRAAIAAGVPVVPIPGASAVLAALAVSGLPTDRFLFAGFLPAKQAARRRAIQALKPVQATLVLLESPRRLAASLADLAFVLGRARGGRRPRTHQAVRGRPPCDRCPIWPPPTMRPARRKGEVTLVIAPPATDARAPPRLTTMAPPSTGC